MLLQESNERFHLFSESTFEGIVVSVKGKILEANDQFAQMFDYQPAEVVGMSAVDLLSPESAELVQKHMASGYEQPYESIGLRKDGSTFPTLLNRCC